ncbi:atherin-like [Prionailurus bengalensis]|uniref:atherin-like n=1 Tax=Prionailurus bengalensis TaxID=37029 RepID=UPI001CA9B5B8|nr:atherin-like [Prionailurus bengalensis]
MGAAQASLRRPKGIDDTRQAPRLELTLSLQGGGEKHASFKGQAAAAASSRPVAAPRSRRASGPRGLQVAPAREGVPPPPRPLIAQRPPRAGALPGRAPAFSARPCAPPRPRARLRGLHAPLLRPRGRDGGRSGGRAAWALGPPGPGVRGSSSRDKARPARRAVRRSGSSTPPPHLALKAALCCFRVSGSASGSARTPWARRRSPPPPSPQPLRPPAEGSSGARGLPASRPRKGPCSRLLLKALSLRLPISRGPLGGTCYAGLLTAGTDAGRAERLRTALLLSTFRDRGLLGAVVPPPPGGVVRVCRGQLVSPLWHRLGPGLKGWGRNHREDGSITRCLLAGTSAAPVATHLHVNLPRGCWDFSPPGAWAPRASVLPWRIKMLTETSGSPRRPATRGQPRSGSDGPSSDSASEGQR